MVCGLIAAVVLARGSVVKAVAMVVLGLLLGLAGTDVNSGIRRFDFGFQGLADGIEFVALSMAIYGIAEVAYNLEKKAEPRSSPAHRPRLAELADIRHCMPAILRGTVLGSLLGVLPGGGALLAAFGAYTLEKKSPSRRALRPRRHPRRRRAGIRQQCRRADLVHPDADARHCPSNPTMAMMIGALMIHGISPGPRVMTDRPELFWGVVASMWIGNLMLVVLNLPLVGIWVRFLRIPYRLLFPAIIVFCCIGTYTINSNVFDVFVMAFFAIFGYLCLKLDCEPAPLILGFVLGPMMEENLRRALLISRGDPIVFVSEPISLAFLIASAFLLIVVAAPAIRSSAKKPCRNSAARAIRAIDVVPLLEISQVRSLLALLGGHQIAVPAHHVIFLADDDVIVGLGTVFFVPVRVRLCAAPVVFHYRPGPRQRVVDHRDLVMGDVRIGLVDVEFSP